jgi:tellurite resistance protein
MHDIYREQNLIKAAVAMAISDGKILAIEQMMQDH